MMANKLDQISKLPVRPRAETIVDIINRASAAWIADNNQNINELIPKGIAYGWGDGVRVCFNVTMPDNLYGKYQVAWNSKAKKLGLPLGLLGKNFKHQGNICEVVGLMPRTNNQPVVILNKGNNNLYRISIVDLKINLTK